MPLSRYMLPIVLSGPPLLAFWLQLRAFWRDRRMRRAGVKGEVEIVGRGVVVDHLENQEYLDTSRTRRVTALRLALPDGNSLTFEEDLGGRAESLPVGAKLPIVYDPADPLRHVVGDGVTRKSLLGAALLGMPFFLAGLWVLLGSD